MLNNERLLIRCIEDQDIPARVTWLNNPVVNRTLNFDLPVSSAATKAWLGKICQRSDRKDFTIVDRASGKAIGWCGLLNINIKDGKAEIYGGIGETDFWGKGLAISVWELLLDYGFNYLNLNKIYSTVWTENFAMCHIHEKLGFLREGTLREDIRSHGALRDRHLYGILRSEYSTK